MHDALPTAFLPLNGADAGSNRATLLFRGQVYPDSRVTQSVPGHGFGAKAGSVDTLPFRAVVFAGLLAVRRSVCLRRPSNPRETVSTRASENAPVFRICIQVGTFHQWRAESDSTRNRWIAVHSDVIPMMSTGSAETHGSLIVWLPFLCTYRTICLAPEPPLRRVLEEIRGMRFAAWCRDARWMG